ncbi:MAG TPA: glycosyltransferase family 9 protein [Rhizomicrobium sp.]|nr:glycosyltransferase family 9 protein [Rhizomicrobium sp.]
MKTVSVELGNRTEGATALFHVITRLSNVQFRLYAGAAVREIFAQSPSPNVVFESGDIETAPALGDIVAVVSHLPHARLQAVLERASSEDKPVLLLGSSISTFPGAGFATALPADPALWENEIRSLTSSETEYQAAVTRLRTARDKALSRARAYTFDLLTRTRTNAGLLIGVGSGIGNILHTTPMIRNIARRTGERVDVVVTSDHPGSLFLVRNQDYVANVFTLNKTVLERHYDRVFLTHSFGAVRVPFRANQTLWSRDWDRFRPGDLHETLFNLEAARKLLGVPYEDTDAHEYYLSDLKYHPPARTLIGFHAGSKGGFWASKRWPHFELLAERLSRQGYDLASFGTEDEYVTGTENRTGGSIEDMARGILDCSLLISNDSGVMNIANALGIPVVAIFAPTNVETRLPLRETTTAVVLQKDCSPCEVKNHAFFASGACRCIAEVSIEEVERTVLAALRAARSSHAGDESSGKLRTGQIPSEMRETLSQSLAAQGGLPLSTARRAVETGLDRLGVRDAADAQHPTVQTTRGTSGDTSAHEYWRSEADLAAKLVGLGAIADAKLPSLIAEFFRKRDWKTAAMIADAAIDKIAGLPDTLLLAARANLTLGRLARVVDLLETIPRDEHTPQHLFYLGTAYRRLERIPESLAAFEKCVEAGEPEPRFLLEGARAQILAAFGAYGRIPHQSHRLAIARDWLKRCISLQAGNVAAHRELARLELALGSKDEALARSREAVLSGPSDTQAHLDLARIALRVGNYEEAANAARRAAEIGPQGTNADFLERMAKRLEEEQRPQKAQSFAFLRSHQTAGLSLLNESSEELARGALDSILAATDADWIVLNAVASTRDIGQSVKELGFPWAGAIFESDESPLGITRSLLATALRAGVLKDASVLSDVVDFARSHAAGAGSEPKPHDPSAKPLALLVSQFGIERFGGAEQFIAQAASVYRDEGYDVIVVGTRPERRGESGSVDGLSYVYVEGSPEALFALAVQKDADIVHVVSGLGLEAALALRQLRSKLVFGVHFWRELFYNETPNAGYFPDVDLKAEARREFGILLEDAAAIYSNSIFTKSVIEKHFGVRTPVIYSLPEDNETAAMVPADERDFVLLVNSRDDKGFGHVLAVAKRLPERSFVAIASQTSKEIAEAQIRDLGLSNVTIIDRVDDLDDLYSKARVVAVPSYRFVETFSRVVIEAHRHGTPVIGSNRGNVPLLLAEAGIALPEDVDAWATHIDRLFSDVGYWAKHSRLARENSSRYSFDTQKRQVQGMVSGTRSPLLVGVGSGVGNIIHCAPLIRNLALRLGKRIDVVVAGDFSNLLFLPDCHKYVNHVFSVGPQVLRRRYATVFLTHSFGDAMLDFASANVISSRQWRIFTPEDPLHEAEFNLAAAEATLGVRYEPEDVRAYYVGDLSYKRPEKRLIGIHAGSKSGIWASKRWPHFEKLVAELVKRGIPVASFGVAEEYVGGTIDRTGGTVEEMARAMLECSSFVSNDSGVMNIANALGIPLTAIFGPTNARTRGPLAPTSRSIALEKYCAPCESHPEFRTSSFLAGSCSCIGDIQLRTVLEAVLTNEDLKP